MATATRLSLVDRIHKPVMAEAPHRLLDHAKLLDQIPTVAGDLPSLVAIAGDFCDAISRKASQDGINLEQHGNDVERK